MVGYIFYKDENDEVYEECYINETALQRDIDKYKKQKGIRFIAIASPTNISLVAHNSFVSSLLNF